MIGLSWRELYSLDAAALLLFAVSYYRNCYRQGYGIDFWHGQLLLFCIGPYFLTLFFITNPLNAVIVGSDFTRVTSAVPQVFFIVIIGYAFVVIGGNLWSFGLGVGARKAAVRALDVVPRCSLMLMSSWDLLVLLAMVCLCLQGALLLLYFSHNGFGFDLRAYTFDHPGVRPLAQITALSSVIVASHCLARYADTRELSLLLCTMLLSFGLLFFGQRGNIFAIFMNIGLCYVLRLRKRVSLAKVFLGVSLLVVLVLYLGNAREGKYSLGEFLGSLFFLLLYGNTFTDLRDFSWVYSGWNHVLWLGRTYLAGLVTFLPRGASDFRATWSFGIATGWTVGLDTESHPGLKPGLFGEAYFNFGWVGVLALGLLYGAVLRRVDIDVKAAMRARRPMMVKAYSSTTLLIVVSCAVTSLTLPLLYALIGVYLFAWVYLRAKDLVVAHP